MAVTDYAFTSTWLIRAPRDQTWSFLVAPEQGWTDWWPGLQSIDLVRTGSLLGSTAVCRWRSPWGYVVQTHLEVIGIRTATQVVLRAAGDLSGRGTVSFDDHGGGTRIVTRWDVTTTPRWMRLGAPVLRPVFSIGHHVIMRRGERGLNRALTGSGDDTATASTPVT